MPVAMVEVRLSMSMAPRPHTIAVDELAAERIVGPVVGVGRHHVGVAEQGQRRCGRVGAGDAGHQ